MIDHWILRTRKYPSAIKMPVFRTKQHWNRTSLQKFNQGLVRSIINSLIALTCVCYFVFGFANLWTNWTKRIVGKGCLVWYAPLSSDLEWVCDIAACAVASRGTGDQILFGKIDSNGIIAFNDKLWLDISDIDESPARSAEALVFDWGDGLALSPVEALGVGGCRHFERSLLVLLNGDGLGWYLEFRVFE